MSLTKVDIKVVLLGSPSVGKTSLLHQYLYHNFNTNMTSTVGAAFGSTKLELNGRSYLLGVWDTAGSERYESLSQMYYRSARAAIVCYGMSWRPFESIASSLTLNDCFYFR